MGQSKESSATIQAYIDQGAAANLHSKAQIDARKVQNDADLKQAQLDLGLKFGLESQAANRALKDAKDREAPVPGAKPTPVPNTDLTGPPRNRDPLAQPEGETTLAGQFQDGVSQPGDKGGGGQGAEGVGGQAGPPNDPTSTGQQYSERTTTQTRELDLTWLESLYRKDKLTSVTTVSQMEDLPNFVPGLAAHLVNVDKTNYNDPDGLAEEREGILGHLTSGKRAEVEAAYQQARATEDVRVQNYSTQQGGILGDSRLKLESGDRISSKVWTEAVMQQQLGDDSGLMTLLDQTTTSVNEKDRILLSMAQAELEEDQFQRKELKEHRARTAERVERQVERANRPRVDILRDVLGDAMTGRIIAEQYLENGVTLAGKALTLAQQEGYYAKQQELEGQNLTQQKHVNSDGSASYTTEFNLNSWHKSVAHEYYNTEEFVTLAHAWATPTEEGEGWFGWNSEGRPAAAGGLTKFRTTQKDIMSYARLFNPEDSIHSTGNIDVKLALENKGLQSGVFRETADGRVVFASEMDDGDHNSVAAEIIQKNIMKFVGESGSDQYRLIEDRVYDIFRADATLVHDEGQLHQKLNANDGYELTQQLFENYEMTDSEQALSNEAFMAQDWATFKYVRDVVNEWSADKDVLGEAAQGASRALAEIERGLNQDTKPKGWASPVTHSGPLGPMDPVYQSPPAPFVKPNVSGMSDAERNAEALRDTKAERNPPQPGSGSRGVDPTKLRVTHQR